MPASAPVGKSSPPWFLLQLNNGSRMQKKKKNCDKIYFWLDINPRGHSPCWKWSSKFLGFDSQRKKFSPFVSLRCPNLGKQKAEIQREMENVILESRDGTKSRKPLRELPSAKLVGQTFRRRTQTSKSRMERKYHQNIRGTELFAGILKQSGQGVPRKVIFCSTGATMDSWLLSISVHTHNWFFWER